MESSEKKTTEPETASASAPPDSTLPPASPPLAGTTAAGFVVPAWAIAARAFLRKGLIVSAAITGAGYVGTFAILFLGGGPWVFFIPGVGFAGIVVFSLLQVLLLVAGFVQYSLSNMLKYTLIGAACMSAAVAGAHWSIQVLGGIGLLWLLIFFFRAATDADTRQK